MPRVFARRSGALVGMLLGMGLLGTFGVSLSSSTFIAHESSILRLLLLSWWRNVPLIFSRDFLMFSDGQFRPLSYALLAVVRTFFSVDNVLFWHLWLLAFHGLNTILVFVLVRRFSKHLWSAGLSAAMFGFHPLSAMVVNNIDHFHYVLGLTFYLGSLWGYQKSCVFHESTIEMSRESRIALRSRSFARRYSFILDWSIRQARVC